VEIPLPRQVRVDVVPATLLMLEGSVWTEVTLDPSSLVVKVVAPDALLSPMTPFDPTVSSGEPDDRVKDVLPSEHDVTLAETDDWALHVVSAAAGMAPSNVQNRAARATRTTLHGTAEPPVSIGTGVPIRAIHPGGSTTSHLVR
jgi:hypothetical protein